MPPAPSVTEAPPPAATTSPVLDVSGFGHRYGDTVAAADVDLTVARGECVALLGPNGAGKTTTVNAITGLVEARTGRVEVVGGDPRRAATRRHLGVVQQSVGLPRTLTVRELVRGAAVRHGVPASAAGPVLAEVGLADLHGRRVHKLSGGQAQRLHLAAALVGDPALLVLDEPTTGLDVQARREFWRLLERRKARGTGVLLTTHLIEESASVADRVVVLAHGRVVASGTPDQLRVRLPDRTVTCRTRLDDATLAGFDEASRVERRDDGLVRISTRAPEELLRGLLAADVHLDQLRVEGASLEEAVLGLTTEPAAPSDAAPTTEVDR